MDGYFVEVQTGGHIMMTLDVPVLDCVRIPPLMRGTLPQPANWLPDGPGKWAAHYDVVQGSPDDYRAERIELRARRHT